MREAVCARLAVREEMQRRVSSEGANCHHSRIERFSETPKLRTRQGSAGSSRTQQECSEDATDSPPGAVYDDDSLARAFATASNPQPSAPMGAWET